MPTEAIATGSYRHTRGLSGGVYRRGLACDAKPARPGCGAERFRETATTRITTALAAGLVAAGTQRGSGATSSIRALCRGHLGVLRECRHRGHRHRRRSCCAVGVVPP
eukprot:gene14773-biopygen5374